MQKKEYSLTMEYSSLKVEGALTFAQSGAFLKEAMNLLVPANSDSLDIDLFGLKNMDSGGMCALLYLKSLLTDKGVTVRFCGAQKSLHRQMQLFAGSGSFDLPKLKSVGIIEGLGLWFREFWSRDVLGFLYLASEMFHWSFMGLFQPKSRRKGEVVNQAVQIGVGAVPIVMALAFIIGLVLALQSAAQLRNFGANIFIVDLTVIAMMREMGPLITAILVAGRSGSAIAAEIATMKVSSELDALTTMGLNPIRFVVVPKIYGALLTVPLLTILADVCGILGGAMVAYLYLDIAPEVFMNRIPQVLLIRDLYVGFVKSLVFTGLIVFIGSYFGFRASRGAEGVGRMTTRAVVVSIAFVIVADSILGLIFY